MLPDRRFQWVNQGDPVSARQAKRHSARESRRAQRSRAIQEYLQQQQPKVQAPPGLGPVEGQTRARHQQPHDLDIVELGDSPSSQDSGHGSARPVAPKSEKVIELNKGTPFHPYQCAQQGVTIRRPRPIRNLSSYQADMFPVPLDHRGQYLCHHFLRVMPSLIQNVKESVSNKEILNPLSMLGPTSFRCIVLVVASMHIARLHGLPNSESTESLFHKTKAIQLIHSQLSAAKTDAAGAANEMIAAVLGLAYSENQFGEERMTLLHMKAAMRMVRLRGGHEVLDELPILSMFVNWVMTDMVSPLCFADLPTLSSRISTHGRARPGRSGVPDPSTKYTDLEDFLNFLLNAEILSLLHRRLSPNMNPVHRAIFRSGTTFHYLLSQNIAYKGWDADRNCRVALNLQMNALILTTVTLWNYRDSPATCDAFLKELNRRAIEEDLDISFATGIFLGRMWAIEYEGDKFAINPQAQTEKRMWYAGRMLKVARVLSQETFSRVLHALLAFLMMEQDATDIISATDGMDWRMNIREEVLSQHAKDSADSEP
jgi:Fungal specific transcription factor domain